MMITTAHFSAAARLAVASRHVGRTVAVVVSVVALATPASGQHNEPPDPVEGGRAFQARCANCHGANGDLVPGIDLGAGHFRRTMSDDDLIGIILTGIPGTPMPATNMTREQAASVVAYLRTRATDARAGTTPAGDPARGRALFSGKGNCTSCHRVAGIGSRVAPDLTSIGAVRSAADLRRSLLDPSAEIQPANRSYRVVLRDGTTVSGRLLSHDTFTVQILDTGERLRSFVKADLREQGFAASSMPSYRTALTDPEIADVVSFLSSLRPAAQPAVAPPR